MSYVLAGKSGYAVTKGKVTFNKLEILDSEPEERAVAGLFLAFQYSVEIHEFWKSNFLRTALNAQKRRRGKPS